MFTLTNANGNYRVDWLPNNKFRVYHRPSKTVGLFDENGEHLNGKLQQLPGAYKNAIRKWNQPLEA